jgi:hypothetical protein
MQEQVTKGYLSPHGAFFALVSSNRGVLGYGITFEGFSEGLHGRLN